MAKTENFSIKSSFICIDISGYILLLNRLHLFDCFSMVCTFSENFVVVSRVRTFDGLLFTLFFYFCFVKKESTDHGKETLLLL